MNGRPSLIVLVSVSLVLLLCGLGIAVATAGVPPLPFAQGATVSNYLLAHPAAVQTAAVATFASSVPLAIYAATVTARLRQLGTPALGVTIAFTGGILAAAALGLCGLVLWTLSRPEVSTAEPLTRALYYLVFLTGGTAHLVMLGLLVGGMAVASLSVGLLPRPLAWAGVVIAAIAELTTLVLIWPGLSPLLPVARFSGLVWLIVAGALLPRLSRSAT
ncbi:MAG TPA: hypothetical protein VFB19_09230 [Mycobacterium sp.]|nr:hypothetical protein [Mycobacterium sp.]